MEMCLCDHHIVACTTSEGVSRLSLCLQLRSNSSGATFHEDTQDNGITRNICYASITFLFFS
ncbi:hypothetical protein BC939DRAFT_463799 [Gamsiella multidivaricata]|uniref:uncharacterized protein n=1 Tax=Gamsiella multidivaricata TaxID=101098 RepID=UPI0022206955|nr:uncharacterized protein BC939DRAFT_463799 [Gamsiella multidivaricata]KAI7818138.1 hypothetical protein BC939DRAFT_463799 [Gamsiella multidivaricata]